ncbi:hypothetical protein M409DRAFT_22179 [Zasmidium cellare ATCC 36951]|uniref:PEBP-like protein n=1 Tax=Zasmidium cellare ATCC 36951 TaxID=1080233 RepID=A0A6A6CMC5_ZASCE|nr:uncharacterized protein M409DRAFT_22179 [Zasmidium cellare ATCC 36951]KAF2167368.1 hypothetical protein M409DRAFT_22179 [Zasmidium cellare ATCC 36951]
MPSITICVSVLVASLAAAQTPDGFSIKSQLPLRITLNPLRTPVVPGMLDPINETVAAPTLYVPDLTASNTTTSYTAMMIDEAVPLFHWLQIELVEASCSNKTLKPAANSSNNGIITPFVCPQPLRGQGPHGYVVLLFRQPESWSMRSKYSNIVDPKTPTGS